jgi:hypothetical protein
MRWPPPRLYRRGVKYIQLHKVNSSVRFQLRCRRSSSFWIAGAEIHDKPVPRQPLNDGLSNAFIGSRYECDFSICVGCHINPR